MDENIEGNVNSKTVLNGDLVSPNCLEEDKSFENFVEEMYQNAPVCLHCLSGKKQYDEASISQHYC